MSGSTGKLQGAIIIGYFLLNFLKDQEITPYHTASCILNVTFLSC